MIDIGLSLYTGALGLILIGLYGMASSAHIIRVIFSLSLLEAGANLFLVSTGYRHGDSVPPIIQGISQPMVDPIPQALVLTSIVIGVGGLALALGLAIRVHQAYGTLDIKEVQRRMLEDIDADAGNQRGADPQAPLLPAAFMHKEAEK